MVATFTVSAAAAVTGLDVRAVNKAIENGIVRTVAAGRSAGLARRLLPLEQLLCLQLEHDLAPTIVLDARRALIRAAAERPRAGTVSLDGTLVVRVDQSRRRLAEQLRRLARAERMVGRDPAIMGGAPVFRGTRIPVHAVAEMLDQGATFDDVAEGYPSLTAAQIALAPLYAKAHPRRGRPPRQPWRTGAGHRTTRRLPEPCGS